MTFLLKLLRVRFSEPQRPQAPRAHEHVRLGNPWHAVSIFPGNNCCAAARELTGTRFLSSETPPTLPLKGCSQLACTCRYRHHDDRRAQRGTPPAGITGQPPRRRSDDVPSH
jgi:hypothetical protein